MDWHIPLLNSVSNFQNKLLDLVFTDDIENTSEVNYCNQPLSKIDLFHMRIDIILSTGFSYSVIRNSINKDLNFNRRNFSSLNSFWFKVDWTSQFSGFSNLDDIIDKFYDILKVGVALHVPF